MSILATFTLRAIETKGPQETIPKSYGGQLPPPMLCSEFAPRPNGVPRILVMEDSPRAWSSDSQESPHMHSHSIALACIDL